MSTARRNAEAIKCAELAAEGLDHATIASRVRIREILVPHFLAIGQRLIRQQSRTPSLKVNPQTPPVGH